MNYLNLDILNQRKIMKIVFNICVIILDYSSGYVDINIKSAGTSLYNCYLSIIFLSFLFSFAYSGCSRTCIYNFSCVCQSIFFSNNKIVKFYKNKPIFHNPIVNGSLAILQIYFLQLCEKKKLFCWSIF